MASTLDELVVKLSADVSELSKGMEEGTRVVSESTKKIEGAVSSLSENSGKHFFSFSHMAETALSVFEGEALLEGIHKFGEMVKEVFTELVTESIAAAQKQEDAVQRMNVALASAGQYSREASEGMVEFAHAIQQTTKYAEEDVLQASALIESLGKLDKEGLEQATKGAVNLSAALGVDLNTAAMLVGKAAAGHTETFNRYGMSIEKGATNAETFANALKAINGLGDVAAQQANTYSGVVAQLGHNWEDAQKELGAAFTQNQAVIGVMKELNGIIQQASEYVKEHQKDIKEWIADGIIYAARTMEALGIVVDMVWKLIKADFELMAIPMKEFIALIVAAQEALKGNFTAAWEGFKSNSVAALKDVGKAITEETNIGKFNQLMADMGYAAEKNFEKIESGARTTIDPLNQHQKKVKEISEEYQKLAEAGQKLAVKAVDADEGKKYEKDLAELKAARALGLITEQEYTFAVAKENKDRADSKKAALESEIDDLLKRNQLLRQIDLNKNMDEIEANRKKITELQAQEDQHSNHYLETKRKEQQEEERIGHMRLQAGQKALSDLAVFQGSKSKEMAAIGKTAAIANATISTYEGATKAYTSLAGIPLIGPELGFAAAAAAVAAGLANVAQISGTPLATGIDSVPGIGGKDNFPAILAPGERVVPSETNKDLKEFLAHQRSMGGQGPSKVIHLHVGTILNTRDAANHILEMLNEYAGATGAVLLKGGARA